jgi:hypothetical protein
MLGRRLRTSGPRGEALQCPLVRSYPDPTANAAASSPPATPDAAPAPAAARTGANPDLRFLDPIIEGARDAVVERQRHRRARDAGKSGYGGPKQNSTRQTAAIDCPHQLFPRPGPGSGRLETVTLGRAREATVRARDFSETLVRGMHNVRDRTAGCRSVRPIAIFYQSGDAGEQASAPGIGGSRPGDGASNNTGVLRYSIAN